MMMLVLFPQCRHKGHRPTSIRRPMAVAEACEATSGVEATRRTLHKHRSMPEGHDLLVRQARVLATSHHARSTAKSNVSHYEPSSGLSLTMSELRDRTL